MSYTDLTNEVYDPSGAAAAGLGGGSTDAFCANGGKGCSYPLFLGVFITLLPRLVPKIMPMIVKNEKMRERFDDEAYAADVEEKFKERFADNLKLFKKMVEAWKDNTLTFADLGLSPDNPLSKSDVPMFAGDASGFQNDLLRGINFLLDRVDKVGRKDDRISQISDVVWNVMSVAYETIRNYLQS